MTADVFTGGFAHVPPGAQCFPLKTGSKVPATEHAHHDAMPVDKFAPLGNYGIRLDGQFVLVDFDADHPGRAEWESKLPDTWMQQTRRGVHRLYRAPDSWAHEQAKNVKIAVTDDEGFQALIGDIKCHGYLVGPGSVVEGHTYTMLDQRAPVDAPAWLLDLMARRIKADFSTTVNGEEIERDRIELGRNDSELISIAGFLRHRGFNQQAIATMVDGIIDSGILEQDPTRDPYTSNDAARIARSASNYAVGQPLDLAATFTPDKWVSGADMPLVGAPVEWWVHGFVPKGQLCLMYGAGGIGKSTWMSWVAALVTKAGGTFVPVTVEESPRLFLARSVLLGADRSKILIPEDGGSWRFPRDAAMLREALEASKTGFLYFDSVYTHFEATQGANAAERARSSLGPLAEIAQKTGCTIMGMFHENKAGEWLGSVEMLNVGRSILHATRTGNGPLRVSVRKTNNRQPDYHLDHAGVETPWVDPVTGEVQMEYAEDGTLAPMLLVLPGEPTKADKNSVTIDEINEDRRAVAQGRQVEALRSQEAGRNISEIAHELGVSERTVQRYLNDEQG